MSEPTPYEQLGVPPEATFEDIQEAKNKLVAGLQGDPKGIELIEIAYDAILMDRLRKRQEGKIKVPEGIRFPERLMPPPSAVSSSMIKSSPQWVQKLIDTPTSTELLYRGGAFLILILLVLYPTNSPILLQLSLAIGFCFSVWFLNAKERKFGRAVILSIIGLVLGIVISIIVDPYISLSLANIGWNTTQLATMMSLLILWMISSFLR